MSLRKPAKEQPEKFEFTANSLAAAKEIVSNIQRENNKVL